jgi:hypothetical protein
MWSKRPATGQDGTYGRLVPAIRNPQLRPFARLEIPFPDASARARHGDCANGG